MANSQNLSSPTNGDMTVSVTDTDMLQVKKDKKHMIYKVVVVYSNDQSWFIYRKYNEFLNLYDKMKKLFPDADLKLPGKKLFSSLDPHFMRHRREGLNDFVQKLVTHPGLSQHSDVQAFLNIMPSHQHSSTDEEELVESGEQSGKDDSSSGDEEKINLGPSERPAARPSDFEFLKVIGKGSFGKVLVAKHKTEDKIYAVKVLNKSHIMRKNEAKHIMSERNVLVKNVKHPFLVGLHYSFQTPDKLYFVLDYVNGGEESCDGDDDDDDDDDDIFRTKGHVVLTDFGLCKEGIKGRETTSTFCGTPEYLAPEVLHKEPYDKTVDWWCLGSVLYEMMFGLLLQKNKQIRLGALHDLLELQRHPFFVSINWRQLDDKKIKPPYNPNVADHMDLRHFDPEFTREPVPASVGRSLGDQGISASVEEADGAFMGFSYVEVGVGFNMS
ncbi:hypothetical protein LSH36_521g00004 [Paralvinella palmiformis]|uniref:Uncharacterized protein n=1 Tax=Paralvinella palmiformis TaxID=53620 RepID=A0AAD9J877_9ANNE|nr:hypothetical protein LSH36_521g00004 [Paralvinella palmiformis]